MHESAQGGPPVATLAGLVLFGSAVHRFAPGAAIDLNSYPGREKGYATRDRSELVGPLTPLGPRTARTEGGIVEEAMSFVTRNLGVSAHIDELGRRIDRWEVPLEAVRETIVNAVVHRDYLLAGSSVEVDLYPDRLEVTSPGRLVNGITPEGMRQGVRASRNELIKDTLRDYGFLENRGMGIAYIVIGAMRAHNGTEPELTVLDHERFRVRLWIDPPQ